MLATGARSSAAIGFALVLLGLPMRSTADTVKRCPATSTQEVAQLFERWNASLATREPEEVVKLYADKAVLLPALSGGLLVGRDQIRMHFAQFLLRHPQTSVLQRTISIDCATAIDAGTYVYRVTGRRKGTRMLIGGRYALRYEFDNGDWRIVSHLASGTYRSLSPAKDLMATRFGSLRDAVIPNVAGIAGSEPIDVAVTSPVKAEQTQHNSRSTRYAHQSIL